LESTKIKDYSISNDNPNQPIFKLESTPWKFDNDFNTHSQFISHHISFSTSSDQNLVPQVQDNLSHSSQYPLSIPPLKNEISNLSNDKGKEFSFKQQNSSRVPNSSSIAGQSLVSHIQFQLITRERFVSFSDEEFYELFPHLYCQENKFLGPYFL
jgi:hypothetical protein